MFIEDFKKLGFSENEGIVYSCLLSLGMAPPSTIATRTGLKRPNVYRILDELAKRNLILKVKQKNGTFFTVDDVKKIYFYQREKVELAESLVAQLTEHIQPKDVWEVTYYKGREGCISLYNSILELKPKEMVGWVNLDEFYKQVGKQFDSIWTKKRIKRNIQVRLIMKKTKEAQHFKQKDNLSKRETRWLPDGKEFNTICFLYEHNIVFFSGDEEPLGIHLVNPELYNMQKQIFEMNWSQIK